MFARSVRPTRMILTLHAGDGGRSGLHVAQPGLSPEGEQCVLRCVCVISTKCNVHIGDGHTLVQEHRLPWAWT